MNVLITGATGFIGSRLAARCHARGDRVRALGLQRSDGERRAAGELARLGIDAAAVSVTDADALAGHFDDVDVVFHLAAAQHETNVGDAHYRAVNVDGTRNVVAASVRAGVRRFVHASSIGVYGGRHGDVVGSDSPVAPNDIYGETKRDGEAVVREGGGEIEWVIVRIAEAYGPGDTRLLKLFRGVTRRVFVPIGDGRNLHALVFIDDLTSALLRCAEVDAAAGRTLVITGPRAVETRELVGAIAQACGAVPPRGRLPLAPLLALAWTLEVVLRPLGIQPPLHRRRMDFFRKSFSFDGDEAWRVLGDRPRVELAEGVRACAAWYRDQGWL